MKLGLSLSISGGGPSFNPSKFGTDLGAWIRPDESLVTPVSGAVSSLTDKSSFAHVFSQGTAARRPVYNTSSANFGGRPSMTFTKASVHWLRMTAASASAFNCLHNGLGVTIYAVLRFSTLSGTSADRGQVIGTYWTSTGNDRGGALRTEPDSGGRLNLIAATGAAVCLNSRSANGSYLSATNLIIRAQHGTSLSPDSYYNGVAASTGGDYSTAPSTSDTTGFCTLGATPALSEIWDGELAELIVVKKITTPAEDAGYLSYANSYFNQSFLTI